jgi:hypothetical protein
MPGAFAFLFTAKGTMEFSIFSSVDDVIPTGGTAANLTELYHFLKIYAALPTRGKADRRLLSPAIYHAIQQRAAKYATAADLLVLDSDSPDNNMVEVMMTLEEHGVSAIVHTSYSHTADANRFRVILPLSLRLYGPEEYKAVWLATANLLAPFKFDPGPSNIASLYYLPSPNSSGQDGLIYLLDGNALDVELLLLLFSPSAPETAPAPSSQFTGSRVRPNSLITPVMEQRFRAAPVGRRFYRLMCEMAARAIWRDWPISTLDVATEALMFDGLATGKQRENVLHEVENALAWARSHVVTPTPLQRLRHRLVWRMGR